jgi:integrase
MRVAGHGAAWIRRCATVLNRTLELARKRGLVDVNPAKDAARPRLARVKPVAPGAEEVRELLVRVRRVDPELADAVTVLASTGMRLGELLGLWWKDVNWVAAEVHVAWAITDGGPGVRVVRKPTKRADWRDVPLTESAVSAFRAQWDRQTELLRAEPIGESYVLPGGIDPAIPMRPERLQNRWIATRGPSLVTLGQFRHYAATAMLDAGESYRTVADILGNSESTLRLHYDGRTDVGKRKAIAALELGGRRG